MRSDKGEGGSTNGVGPWIQWFRINNLELVDLPVKSWNQLTSWLGLVERLRSAA